MDRGYATQHFVIEMLEQGMEAVIHCINMPEST
jgi:hypothetical protein